MSPPSDRVRLRMKQNTCWGATVSPRSYTSVGRERLDGRSGRLRQAACPIRGLADIMARLVPPTHIFRVPRGGKDVDVCDECRHDYERENDIVDLL
jgi:hypothetical protein